MNDPYLQHPFASPLNASSTDGVSVREVQFETTHHLLTGSFQSLSLFLLAFSPLSRKLRWIKTVPGSWGPHQFLAKIDYHGRSAGSLGLVAGHATTAKSMRLYATSWALPPMLHCWGLEKGKDDDEWEIWKVGKAPITAVSSYITVLSPHGHIYSTGGPTGEVHLLDEKTGGFGERVQEILFVEEDKLREADKTRVALRYGSHAIEFTPDGKYAFVPVLGTNSIEMYARDPETGRLTHVRSVGSPRKGERKEDIVLRDGPRHLKVHPNGNILYCVTEHSNMIDAYRIVSTGNGILGLQHVSSRSLLPRSLASSQESGHKFRGDTLMLSPDLDAPEFVVTTTRGSTPDVRGWLSIFRLDEHGEFVLPDEDDGERYETPTSGGRANAIDLLAKEKKAGGNGVWILLTDDEDNCGAGHHRAAVRVLEWNGFDMGGIKVVAEWPIRVGDGDDDDAARIIKGASHAIWLD